MNQLDMGRVKEEDAILKVMVTDLSGSFKEIISHTSRLPEICQVGMAYDGSSFSGINPINSSDSILLGVPETLVKVPQQLADSDKPEYMIICNIVDGNHQPHPNCARSQLIRLQGELGKSWDQGRMFMGSEPEAYFISKENGYTDDYGEGNANYFNPRDPRSKIITELANVLNEMGFDVERAHTEVGNEQFETNWRFDLAERTADKIQYYKLIAHKVAQRHGYDVTFLPKPYPNRNGSGMHCHLSVQNTTTNLFYDESDVNNNFSAKALHFLAGILHHARSLAVITNRTEVSYARLVPGFEAPTLIAASPMNRSAVCRIPMIADSETKRKAIRAEFRFPDPLANPYLLAAGFVAAGLDGIEKSIQFPGFITDNLYALTLDEVKKRGITLLPRNLWEAYQEYEGNDSLGWKLGAMHAAYAEIILDEIDACQRYANTHSMELHYLS